MKDEILKLRSKGKTYDEIREVVGCSKGTISYYCGNGQKEKSLKRNRRNRKTKEEIIWSKLDCFLRAKVRDFKLSEIRDKTVSRASYKSFYNKIHNNPYCYLTGRKIDLENNKSYQLDHMIPLSKEGKSSLKNLGLTCRDANQAKADMLLDDFVQLCKDVCENFGYRVVKK